MCGDKKECAFELIENIYQNTIIGICICIFIGIGIIPLWKKNLECERFY